MVVFLILYGLFSLVGLLVVVLLVDCLGMCFVYCLLFSLVVVGWFASLCWFDCFEFVCLWNCYCYFVCTLLLGVVLFCLFVFCYLLIVLVLRCYFVWWFDLCLYDWLCVFTTLVFGVAFVVLLFVLHALWFVLYVVCCCLGVCFVGWNWLLF